ncbi:substrate-binding domain-containing protein [Aerococcus urinaeequi]|uniref:substrate-binding domain-containing protein n=1 Tax=Aerococcus urinaeequi TaxID=51665 RepID=UPI003D6B2CEC
MAPAVEAANSAGIPVILVDRTSDSGEVVTLVVSDNVAGGEMAAQYIVDTVGEGAKTVQLEGVPGASATNERGQGFMNVAETSLNVLDSQTANFDPAEGLTVMENMLQGNSDVQAVFAQNDEMALGAIEAIQGAGLSN